MDSLVSAFFVLWCRGLNPCPVHDRQAIYHSDIWRPVFSRFELWEAQFMCILTGKKMVSLASSSLLFWVWYELFPESLIMWYSNRQMVTSFQDSPLLPALHPDLFPADLVLEDNFTFCFPDLLEGTKLCQFFLFYCTPHHESFSFSCLMNFLVLVKNFFRCVCLL